MKELFLCIGHIHPQPLQRVEKSCMSQRSKYASRHFLNVCFQFLPKLKSIITRTKVACLLLRHLRHNINTPNKQTNSEIVIYTPLEIHSASKDVLVPQAACLLSPNGATLPSLPRRTAHPSEKKKKNKQRNESIQTAGRGTPLGFFPATQPRKGAARSLSVPPSPPLPLSGDFWGSSPAG